MTKRKLFIFYRVTNVAFDGTVCRVCIVALVRRNGFFNLSIRSVGCYYYFFFLTYGVLTIPKTTPHSHNGAEYRPGEWMRKIRFR